MKTARRVSRSHRVDGGPWDEKPDEPLSLNRRSVFGGTQCFTMRKLQGETHCGLRHKKAQTSMNVGKKFAETQKRGKKRYEGGTH